LTEQVHIKEKQKRDAYLTEKFNPGFLPGGMFEVIDEKQKLRDKMAEVNHKKYISNAIHDIQFKLKQKDEILRGELEGAAVLMRASELQAELERQKLERKKEEQIKLTEKLFKENLELTAERARKKEEKFKADRAYVKETDAKFEREEASRRADVARMFNKANSDGPATQVTKKIKEDFARNTEDMFTRFRNAENSLNHQLKASEDASHKAELIRKTALLGEYDKVLIKKRNIDLKVAEERKKAHDDMVAFQQKHIQDTLEYKERRRQAAAKYQELLNQQLSESRNSSLNALKGKFFPYSRYFLFFYYKLSSINVHFFPRFSETMVERERKFNGDLIRAYLK
jgi:hypothetical protein